MNERREMKCLGFWRFAPAFQQQVYHRDGPDQAEAKTIHETALRRQLGFDSVLPENGRLSFTAPWARGHGLARMLALAIEEAARGAGLRVLNLDVRETQEAAIKLYDSLDYQRWGMPPHYAWLDGRWVTGYFYHKDLTGNGARP